MYQQIKKQRLDKVMDMVSASPKAGNLHVEEGKIRIEKAIKNGQSQYIFDLKTTDVDGVVTHSLDRNDVFVPCAWGFLLGIKNKSTRVEKLYTFAPKNDGVNPSVFAQGFTSESIDAIYAGFVQWMLDQTAMLSRYPMEKFYKVPETQGAFILNSEDEPVQEGVQLERNLDKDLELIYPRYIIAGTRDHKISVNFDAAGLTFALNDPDNYEANLVLFMDGYLIKGGCQDGEKSPFGEAVGNW